MRVGVIIPARNEAAVLGRVLEEIPRRSVHEIIVVDNGSTDGTAEVARRGGARVVTEPRPGYGRACQAGLRALDPAVDTVAFLDADYADDPRDLSAVLSPIEQGAAELVIGSRVQWAEAGSLTFPQRFGNRLACWLMARCFGCAYTDLGPLRAIWREALERLVMREQTFGWTVEMQAKAARQRLRVEEVPVHYRCRRVGRSKISGTVSGTVRAGTTILWTIVKLAFESPDAHPALKTLDRRQRDFPRVTSHEPRVTGDAAPAALRRLLIFLKDPRPGQVKTRLAVSVGRDTAKAMYQACIELTLERLERLRALSTLCVEPPKAVGRTQRWLGPAWSVRPQRGGTLGERLVEATGDAFSRGSRRVVVIGTDAPWVKSEDIEAAFDALERADVVIGPTEDGGYYLIGLSRSIPALFEQIEWSTPSVYLRTMAKARALGLRVTSLRMGYDLDRIEDVRRFVADERRYGTLPMAVERIARWANQTQ